MPRYRLEYMKKDRARFLSHRELMNTLQRAMRRASFPLTYTRGHHPRPKFSFGPPLGVGVAGLREYMDLELDEEIVAGEYLQFLNDQLPPGISAQHLVKLEPGAKGLGKLINCACYRIEPYSEYPLASVNQLLEDLAVQDSDTADGIIKWCVLEEEGYLELIMRVGQGEVALRTLLDILNKKADSALLVPSQVTRTGLFHLENGCLFDPIKKCAQPLSENNSCALE